MKFMLIAGHGAGDSGATGLGYREADLTREIVALTADKLACYADVMVGNTSLDWFNYLKTNKYDFTGFDYVLEIHFNAGANDSVGDGIVTGTEAYVTTRTKDVKVEEKILENMAELGFTNRGIKKKNFSVISKVNAQGVPAALLEVAFIDDRDDMELYQRVKSEIASAIADGIANGFGIETEGVLTMTQYEELKREIEELKNKMIYNYIDDNMPEWARPTIQKLVDKGYLKGNEEGELGLTDEMLRIFVVNDRAGLYD